MEALPTVPPTDCSLDAKGLETQLERYRRIGEGAELIDTAARGFAVRLRPGVPASDVEKLIAVERECCPFFDITWDPPQRRLAFVVPTEEDGPALDAIAHALELEEARRLIAPPQR